VDQIRHPSLKNIAAPEERHSYSDPLLKASGGDRSFLGNFELLVLEGHSAI
jgi:hypothetical protein